MHETLPPLGEEDGEGLGLKHALEDELADSGGQAVLDVVREAREGLLIQDIMRVGPQTHHEMVMVREGLKRVLVTRLRKDLRFDSVNEGLT